MAVWKLKNCPKCNGGLVIMREKDGWYEECLACGSRKDVSNLVTINAVGQVKLEGPIEVGHKADTEVRNLPNN